MSKRVFFFCIVDFFMVYLNVFLKIIYFRIDFCDNYFNILLCSSSQPLLKEWHFRMTIVSKSTSIGCSSIPINYNFIFFVQNGHDELWLVGMFSEIISLSLSPPLIIFSTKIRDVGSHFQVSATVLETLAYLFHRLSSMHTHLKKERK